MFFHLPFAADTLGKSSLVALHVPHQIQICVGCLSLFLDAWMTSLYFSKVIYPCFCLLYVSFLCLSFVRSLLFIHAGLLSFLPNFPQTRMNCSWAWRKLLSKTNVDQGREIPPIMMSWRHFLILPIPLRWGPNIDQHKQIKHWAAPPNLCFSLLSSAVISIY